MIILGIETSCDETAAALVNAKGKDLSVLANTVSSQIKIHAKWGGVVPNLAAREHVKNIVPVLDATFRKAKISPKNVDLIAVTQGPGLIPALLIGTSAAKTLAYLWNKPLLGIHHIEGHIYANFINEVCKISNNQFPRLDSRRTLVDARRAISKPKEANEAKKLASSSIKFPILCLVVSGGHTQLVLMKKHLDYEIIGQTLDDAVGEAFDKVARILGLGYPGGPAIAKAADQHRLNTDKYSLFPQKSVSSPHESVLRLPRPMINKNNFDFSFSGLKTAVLYKTKQLKTINYELKTELCYEFQQAAIDVLIHKTLKAAQKYHPKTIMLAGGVSANQELRQQLGIAIKKNLPITNYQLPTTNYCIDNAAMIAAAGYFRWQKMTAKQRKKSLANWRTVEANANLKMS